jgi:hypothetical protein
MKLAEWDKNIAPKLNKISGAAGWLCHYAKDIQSAANALPARPAWESLAREYLNSAERELMIALATVRGVRDVYDNLPVIVEEYHQAAE